MSTAKPLWKPFLRFLAPLMLSNALQSLFGTAYPIVFCAMFILQMGYYLLV